MNKSPGLVPLWPISRGLDMSSTLSARSSSGLSCKYLARPSGRYRLATMHQWRPAGDLARAADGTSIHAYDVTSVLAGAST